MASSTRRADGASSLRITFAAEGTTDRVLHACGSETEVAEEFLMGDSPDFAAGLGGTTHVNLILKRRNGTIEKRGRYDDRSTTRSARRDLNGLALSSRDVVALLATELRERH